MRKVLWVATCLLPTLTLGTPHYSRLIVFGDSLSDIGNMPASPSLIEPRFKTIALNLYVPISNPSINRTPKNYTLVTSGKKYPFPAHAPQPLPPLQVRQKTISRNAYSLSWPQFFSSRAARAHMLKTSEIWPWFWWKTHKSSHKNISIDYAWAGAVTDNLCRDFSYQNPNKNCDAASILAGQAAYRATGFQNPSGKTITAVEIPGLGKQVQLFLADSQQHPEIANSNTLYAILIGGNDLNLALLDLKKGNLLSSFDRVLHSAKMRIRQSLETLIEQRGARHIVLFNLFNTSQIPYIQTEIWKTGLIPIKDKPKFIRFSRLMTHIYNQELNFVVQRIHNRYNKHAHQVDIQLFDFYKIMQKVQDLPAFSSTKTRYETCLGTSTAQPADYYTNINNCMHGKDKYLFWNGAHPAMYLNQVIADELVTQLQTQTKPVHMQ